MNLRPKVTSHMVDRTLIDIETHLQAVIARKGDGAFASTLEALGSITQEYDETKAAIHSKNPDEIEKETMDLLISCLWSLASHKAHTAEREALLDATH